MKIECPRCKELFDLTEDIADHIREQVRTKEFEKEIKEQLTAAKKSYEEQQKNAVNKAILAERENSDKLLEAEKKKTEDIKNQLADLNAKAASSEERLRSMEELHKAQREKDVSESVRKEREKYEKQIKEAEDKAAELKNEADKAKMNLELARRQSETDRQQAVLDVRSEYQGKIDSLKSEYNDKLASLEKEKQAVELDRDYYKDLKSRMSTKMIGESLEQHCETEFNKIRMTAFPRAEFGKDNQVSESRSKGDYIFRDYDENGIEIISIMFEMKNEADTTATKKTNKHFFKELDKDRREKKCEYAVLVSLLEADSDLYNQGIVDVSYEYEKMYVIRPQFFIPLISLLRNAAMRSLEARQELVRMQQQDIDLQNFEAAFTDFKDKFGYNYNQASKRFNDAIDEIDKTIEHLNKVKENLIKSGNQLRLANDKVDSVSIRKLTKNSPSIRAMLSDKKEN